MNRQTNMKTNIHSCMIRKGCSKLKYKGPGPFFPGFWPKSVVKVSTSLEFSLESLEISLIGPKIANLWKFG